MIRSTNIYWKYFLYLGHVTSSISLWTYSRLHLSFVAGIHRSQEAIRSFPIRERRAHFPNGTRLALYSETGSGRSRRTAPRSRIEEPARFLPFVAHGSATRDIVSIVPLIGKIKVFRTTTSCTWSHETFISKIDRSMTIQILIFYILNIWINPVSLVFEFYIYVLWTSWFLYFVN